MYRHDARRTGTTACEVPAKLDKRWQVGLGRRLTPPVAVADRIYVAAKNRHSVYALRADDGRTLWTFTADGPVDSPPTIHQGRVLFGCADGCVYCLRASDGELAWRFRAAPAERQIAARQGAVWNGRYQELSGAWSLFEAVVQVNAREFFRICLKTPRADEATAAAMFEVMVDSFQMVRSEVSTEILEAALQRGRGLLGRQPPIRLADIAPAGAIDVDVTLPDNVPGPAASLTGELRFVTHYGFRCKVAIALIADMADAR